MFTPYIPHSRVRKLVIDRDVKSVVLVGLNEGPRKDPIDDDSRTREAIGGNDAVLQIENIVHVRSVRGSRGDEQDRKEASKEDPRRHVCDESGSCVFQVFPVSFIPTRYNRNGAARR